MEDGLKTIKGEGEKHRHRDCREELKSKNIGLKKARRKLHERAAKGKIRLQRQERYRHGNKKSRQKF